MKNTLNFVIAKPAQGARTDLNELKDAIVSGKKSTIDICVESPDTWHLYGRTLSKIEDICMGKKWRNKPKANIISEKQAVVKRQFGRLIITQIHIMYGDINLVSNALNYTQQDLVVLNECRGQLPLSISRNQLIK